MLEVEVFGKEPVGGPSRDEIERLCALAIASAGVDSCHLAVEFVSATRIAELNFAHRGKGGPTDVLSFPIDGAESPRTTPLDASGLDPALPETPSENASIRAAAPPRELGDIVICPEHTTDLREAIVHGALHLVGMDHETDNGEMLALQAKLLREA